jgi:glyoxylase-like metal-dependent hydrolase (beta-lactamase superfamily II)
VVSNLTMMLDLPVADPWFVIQRRRHDVSLISEPHVHPLLRCNVWHVRGRNRDLVVDTALGIQPLRSLVEAETVNPLLAIATHSHGDHVGGMHEFDERAIHASEAQDLETVRAYSIATDGYGEAVLGPYRDAGYHIPELMINAVPAGGMSSNSFELKRSPATQLLHEGDMIDLGDRAFEVLHLPGHSPGCIGLWEQRTGILFSGDAVYDGPLLDELDGSDLSDYCATMRRLRELPVTEVHGGHEQSFGRARLVELCDDYLTRRRQ